MSQLSVTPQQLPNVQAFGPGGQQYVANIWGGFRLAPGVREFEFFNISESQDPIWGRVLTNLKEAGKIGSSMVFKGMQYGPRLCKVDGTAMTIAEMSAAIAFFFGSRVELFIGSNDTKVADFDLAHFLNPISGIVDGALDNTSVALPINQSAWVNLIEGLQQGLGANDQISGRLICNLPGGCPAALAGPAGETTFIWKWELAGGKATRT
jgi:hypothetical protein